MKRILIVDNNPVILKLLSTALEKENFQVVTAKDGLSAFDILDSFTPHIIFLDLVMPNINGEQFCQLISGRKELTHTKIIIISGVAAEAHEECNIQGAHACVAKGRQLVKHVVQLAHDIANEKFNFANNKVIGADEVFSREVSRELLSANRHLKVVLQNMQEGIVELSFHGRIIYVNPAAAQLAGIPKKELLAKEFSLFFSQEHQQRLTQALLQARTTPSAIDEDALVLFNDQHVSINFLPVHDKELKTIIAIIKNINKRKIAEIKLRETTEYFHSIFNTVQAGILVIDAETNKIIDANPKALQMFKATKEEVFDCLCNDFVCQIEKGNCPILDEGNITYEGTQEITNSIGQKLHILRTASVSTFNDRKYVIESFIDISEQKTLETKLHLLAITDELTGLMNRRGFIMMANKQLQIVDRSGDKLLLLFADVDNLKKVNDSYGHEAGDALLIKAAKVLSSLRSSDIIARLGGDEFAILVPDSGGDSMDGVKLVDRFNELLAKENSKENGVSFDLSISFGVATYNPSHPCTIEELIDKADKRMYTSKKLKK